MLSVKDTGTCMHVSADLLHPTQMSQDGEDGLSCFVPLQCGTLLEVSV